MSSLESSCYTFEDGVAIGNEFLRLANQINPTVEKRSEDFLSEDELRPLFDEITKRSRYGRPFPSLEGILSRIIGRDEFETSLCNVWGIDDFWERQSNYAPICEIPPKLGFIQFGDWTGRSDGDAWLVDTAWGRISAMYVGSGEPDEDQVRLSCYANFFSPWQWISFLRWEAWEREWIPKPDNR